MPGRYRLEASASHAERSVIVHALQGAGWEPTEDEDWDLHWSHGLTSVDRYLAARSDQVINHFRGIGALTRKDRLAAAVAAAELRVGRQLGLVPETYALPDDREALMASSWPGPWIVKPRGGGRGEGIWLAPTAADIPIEPGVVVQRYLTDPHLLDGFKYTLRWYVAITCDDPLVVHVFDDGFTKLTSRPFRTDRASLTDRFVHLTNPDVQATNPDVATSERNLTRPAYRQRLAADGHDPDGLHAAARRAIVGCIVAAREQLVRDRLGAGRTMELLGFDLLVDVDLHPWVLEANLAPSVTVEAAATRAAQEESDLKERMARDLCELAGLTAPWDGPPLHDVGGWQLAWPAPADAEMWELPSMPRPADAEAARRPVPGVVVDPGTRWWDLGDGLAVLPTGATEPVVLNPAAAVVHLGVVEGIGVAGLVDDLVAAGVPTDAASVWDMVGDLVDRGALRRADVSPSGPVWSVPLARAPVLGWNDELRCAWGGVTVAVCVPGHEVGSVLRRALEHWGSDSVEVAGLVEVLPTDSGWDVSGQRVRSSLELPSAVREAVVRAARFAGAGFVLRATAIREGQRITLLLGGAGWRADRAAAADAVLADDHLVPVPGGELMARPVGLVAPLPPSAWTDPLAPDVELDLQGQLVAPRVVAEPTSGSIVVDHLEVEGEEQSMGPSACLLALLRHGIGPTGVAGAASLVVLARRVGAESPS